MNTHAAPTDTGAPSPRPPVLREPMGALPPGPAKTGPLPALFEGWPPEDVDLIRRTIAPDAGEHELALYLKLCRTYGLDPFRKELILEKRRRKRQDGNYDVVPVFITTRDGYLKAAMRDPAYAGLVGGVVCEGDHFEYIADEFKVVHRFGAKRGPIIGAWAIAYHEERPPMVGFVPFKEYAQGTEVWQRTPTAMIQKCGEVFVLRRQFNITGIVAREEIDSEDGGESGNRGKRRRFGGPSPISVTPIAPSQSRIEPRAAIDAPTTAAEAGALNGPVGPDTAGAAREAEDTSNPLQSGVVSHDPARTDQAEATAAGTPQSGRPTLSAAERDEIQRLVAQAALAEGFTLVRRQNGGKIGPGQQWLQRHYGTDQLDRLIDRLDEIRDHASRVHDAHEIAGPGTPSQQPASPNVIAELQAAFDHLGYDEPGRLGLIRACTGGRTDRPEQMAEIEIRALIDELSGPSTP